MEADGFVLALHGGWGEDGRLQSVLDLMGVPYSGSRAKASMLAMDKALSKRMFRDAGVPTADWQIVRALDDVPVVHEVLPMPWVIKPRASGSSIGVQLVVEGEAEALAAASSAYGEVIVERYVPGRILTVAIFDLPSGTRILDPLEIRPTESALYDERTKSLGLRTYGGPRLSDGARSDLLEAASSAHFALGCSGITRVDCIYSEECGPVVLEVNTIPGMEPNGNLLQACAAAGIGEPEFEHRAQPVPVEVGVGAGVPHDLFQFCHLVPGEGRRRPRLRLTQSGDHGPVVGHRLWIE